MFLHHSFFQTILFEGPCTAPNCQNSHHSSIHSVSSSSTPSEQYIHEAYLNAFATARAARSTANRKTNSDNSEND